MITFILLWVIAVLVLFLDQKSPVHRWFSTALFLSGFYGIHFLIIAKLNFWLSKYPLILFLETQIIHVLPIILFPYAFLMGAIYYYNDPAKQWQKRRKSLSLILLLPVIITYGIMLFGFGDFNHPRFFLFNSLWVIPYYLTANFLLIKTFFLARTRRQRNNNFLVCIIIPISILDLIINYILPAFRNVSNLNNFLDITLFILFSCIVSRYGFLGRKLQVEKLHLDNSIKTMISGAAILNHSIKNEIAKISMCASNLNIVDLKPTQAKESAQIILRSTDHIMKMLERTDRYTKDFTLEKTLINLKVFLEDILAEFQHQFREKKINLTTNFGPEVWIAADALHLREVFNNVIKNAVEAMESGGKIDLKVAGTKDTVTVIIKDTGAGIPSELLPQVFEPFFTTKNPRWNFGLGLLYCYKALKKHGGTIEIESKPNQGTTVYLNLPKHNRKEFYLARGASNVQNKSISG